MCRSVTAILTMLVSLFCSDREPVWVKRNHANPERTTVSATDFFVEKVSDTGMSNYVRNVVVRRRAALADLLWKTDI